MASSEYPGISRRNVNRHYRKARNTKLKALERYWADQARQRRLDALRAQCAQDDLDALTNDVGIALSPSQRHLLALEHVQSTFGTVPYPR